MSADTIHLRGEGGGVFAFDLPLPDGVQCRVDRDELVRVNEDGTPWVEPVDPEKPLTPKEQLQADAAALGLSTDGTVAEITARIAARPLTDDELLVAVDAKVLDAADAEHDPAEVRAKLADLAAK